MRGWEPGPGLCLFLACSASHQIFLGNLLYYIFVSWLKSNLPCYIVVKGPESRVGLAEGKQVDSQKQSCATSQPEAQIMVGIHEICPEIKKFNSKSNSESNPVPEFGFVLYLDNLTSTIQLW